MNSKVTVYMTTCCLDCWNLKKFLDERHLEYEEKDIETDKEAYRTMMNYTKGKRIIPTISVNGVVLTNPRLKEVEDLLV